MNIATLALYIVLSFLAIICKHVANEDLWELYIVLNNEQKPAD